MHCEKMTEDPNFNHLIRMQTEQTCSQCYTKKSYLTQQVQFYYSQCYNNTTMLHLLEQQYLTALTIK